MQKISPRYELMSKGIFIDPMVSLDKLRSLILTLRPILTQHELIRLGGNADGGYLLPNDLEGIKSCFSPGVNDTASFEQDLYKLGIESHLADYSIDNVPSGTIAKSFIKKYIGINSINEYMSMDDWIELCEPNSSNNDLILQMDIEGAEYGAILGCSKKNLDKFRIIIIEFHQIETWSQSDFFNLVEGTFQKLLDSHYLIHMHPNNATGIVNLNGFDAPRIFEATFIHKSRATIRGYAHLPNILDRPNLDYISEISIPSCWGY